MVLDLFLLTLYVWHACGPLPNSIFALTHDPGIVEHGKQGGPEPPTHLPETSIATPSDSSPRFLPRDTSFGVLHALKQRSDGGTECFSWIIAFLSEHRRGFINVRGTEISTRARTRMALTTPKSPIPGGTSARLVVKTRLRSSLKFRAWGRRGDGRGDCIVKTAMQQLCSDTVVFLVWVVADMVAGSV